MFYGSSGHFFFFFCKMVNLDIVMNSSLLLDFSFLLLHMLKSNDR